MKRTSIILSLVLLMVAGAALFVSSGTNASTEDIAVASCCSVDACAGGCSADCCEEGCDACCSDPAGCSCEACECEPAAKTCAAGCCKA